MIIIKENKYRNNFYLKIFRVGKFLANQCKFLRILRKQKKNSPFQMSFKERKFQVFPCFH